MESFFFINLGILVRRGRGSGSGWGGLGVGPTWHVAGSRMNGAEHTHRFGPDVEVAGKGRRYSDERGTSSMGTAIRTCC